VCRGDKVRKKEMIRKIETLERQVEGMQLRMNEMGKQVAKNKRYISDICDVQEVHDDDREPPFDPHELD